MNFMGRLELALLDLTKPGLTRYVPECCSWYFSNGDLACGMHTFGLLSRAIGVSGLWGIDRLLSFRVVSMLRKAIGLFQHTTQGKLSSLFNQLAGELHPEYTLPRSGRTLFFTAARQCGKLNDDLFPVVHIIGQCQLMRARISSEINLGAQMNSNLLWSSLCTVNQSLLTDISHHYNNSSLHGYPCDENMVISEVAKYLDCSGFLDPMSKLYITCCDSSERLPVFLVLCCVSISSKLKYDSALNILVHLKDKDAVDGIAFIVGMFTILKQFHPEHMRIFFEYLGQYIRLSVKEGFTEHGKSAFTACAGALNCLYFLESLHVLGLIPQKAVYGAAPLYLLDGLSMFRQSKLSSS